MDRKKLFCLILCMGLMLGCIGPSNDPVVQTLDPDTEHVDVVGDPGDTEPMQLPVQDGTIENRPPDSTPSPTRAPREGDIATDRFPDYDTGWDADYSYQSDELRIAIRKYEIADEGQVYYIADIWTRNLSSLRMDFAHGKFDSGRENPEAFATRDNVIFGVSGTMNSGLVVHNGQKYKDVEQSDIAFRSGIAVIYRDGSVRIFKRSKETFSYKTENGKNGGIWQAFQFGPVLVQNGKALSGLKKNERHPRIIFGYYEPGHYAAVAVDGRTKKAIGMTETEMAQLMERLGCQYAMNLDGGTSAVMLFMGKTINTPSGKDKDGDGIAGRNIVDMLQFAEFDENGAAPDLSTVHADKFLGE